MVGALPEVYDTCIRIKLLRPMGVGGDDVGISHRNAIGKMNSNLRVSNKNTAMRLARLLTSLDQIENGGVALFSGVSGHRSLRPSAPYVL